MKRPGALVLLATLLILSPVEIFSRAGKASLLVVDTRCGRRMAGSGGQASGQDAPWLDRRVVNWNRRMGSLPRPLGGRSEAITGTCRVIVRQPESPAERALVRAGWTLYGAVQSYSETKVITALSGVDGMCRPLGYQAFVYWEGRYAGTLSPDLMTSRMDGALLNLRLVSPTRITAEFARYNDEDALCCPSRASYVDYEISRDDAPLVVPTNVSTSAVCQTSGGGGGNDSSGNDSTDAADALFNRKWRLTEVKGAPVGAGDAFITFNRERRAISGNTGCNLMSGGFEINGTHISFQRVITTRRACLNQDVMRVEREFTRALEEATRFAVEGNRLRLYRDNQLLLTLTSE